ncbi:hypothetical protein [Methylorubrum thiocyanatum]|uniref:hypothetical protein n=1 Tax=Methylorubrum thiocyanatum TaxID=47958 RepID=UPI0035C7B2FA
MSLDRQLARLTAVVIVMIAAVFGVSAAQAHGGHAHPEPAAVTVEHVATTPAAVTSQAVQAAATRVFEAAPSVVAQAPSAKVTAKASDDRPCNGICCRLGASCCAAGILPSLTPALRLTSVTSRLVFSEQRAGPSIAREALPKPPRSFA